MSKKFKDLNEVLNTIMRNDLSDEERKMIEKVRAERKAREAQNSKSNQTSNNANSTGQRGSSGGLTDAQLKALKDKVDADRRAGKMSDLRGGNDKVDGYGKPKTPVANTPAPKPAPAKDRMAGASKEDRMAAWAKANPKLAAAKAERDRTRGTSATTNPLMKDMKSRLPAPKPAANAAKPAANVGAPGSQPKGEDLLTGPKPAAKPAPTPARPAAAPTPARPAVTGAGNRTADLARARRQAMLNTVSKSPNAQRIAARNPMVQKAIAAERGAVNQSIRNSVARANTPANLNRTAPQRKVNTTTGGVQSVGSGGAATPAKRKEPLFESKKTFSQFTEEAHNLNEALPLIIPAAMKLGSLALGAYSAYEAGKKLKKGDYKGAALDAVGALPVGRAVSGIARGLGAGKKLQGLAGFAGNLAKYEVPNEKNKLINKTIDKGIDLVSGTPGQGSSTQASKPAATPKPTTKPQQTSAQREAQARSTTTTTQTKPTTTKSTSTTKDTTEKKPNKPQTRMQSMQSATRWV